MDELLLGYFSYMILGDFEASRLVDATDRADLYRNSVDSAAQRMIYGVWFDESRIEDSKRVCV